MKYKNLEKIWYQDKEIYEQTYKNRFGSEQSVIFDFKIAGFPAFFTYTGEITQLINKIHILDKKLKKLSEELPEQALEQFTLTSLVDEINFTNEIEGVASTRKEILNLVEIINNKEKSKDRLFGLVMKYFLLKEEDINISSSCDVKKIYDELVLEEVKLSDPEDVPDGIYFRKRSVYVQNSRQETIHTGVIGEENIIDMMDKTLNILNSEEIPNLISISIAHYMIGYIHPYYDDNGRLNRFVSSKYLVKELDNLIGYGLSYVIKQNKKKYDKSFALVNDKKNRGDLTPFIITFLEFILEVENYNMENISTRLDRWQYYVKKMKIEDGKSKKDIMLKSLLTNSLFGIEGMSLADIEKITGIGNSTIRKYLNELDKDMLRVQRDGRINRYDINLEYY